MTKVCTPDLTRHRSFSVTKCALTILSISFILVDGALAISVDNFQFGRNESSPADSWTATRVQNSILHEPYKEPRVDEATCEKNVCLTPSCIHEASSILKNMDQSTEPCDDFYKFACGNFLKNTIIPDDETRVDSFKIVNDKLQKQLRIIIEEESNPNEIKSFRLVKTFYKSCMNKCLLDVVNRGPIVGTISTPWWLEPLIEEQGLAPFHKILKDLGGWPVLLGDRWREDDFTWKDAIYKFRKVGYSVDYFIDFGISVNLKNNTRRIIELDQASLRLSREYFSRGMENEVVKAYYTYMVDVAEILGATKTQAAKELKESLEFEMKLSNISLAQEERRNFTALFNLMTVRKLSEEFPSIPWMEYLNTILAPSTSVTEDELVMVPVPSFITGLEELLEQTPKRVQANYVMWRAVDRSVRYLTEELRNRQLEYSGVVSGRTEREPRWKECMEIVSSSLPDSIGSLYVRSYFNEDAKKTAVEIVSNIRQEFKKILETTDWMDEETRKVAIDKAESMSTHIAYPDELLNNTKLEELYLKLEIGPDNFLQSVLNFTLFSKEHSYERLRQSVNKSDWIDRESSADVNAMYSITENSIVFPAGILQGVFFSNDRPKYMNYGAIGFIMGHEITHGFDDQGCQFDKEGRLAEWWQPSTKEKYNERAKCIIHQYGNYTSSEVALKLNGINTQGENIADNGGIKEAYLAYNEWARRNDPEPKLPGLKYTPHQMFWISAATTWCRKVRPESIKRQITNGVHSPSEFRINGAMSNSHEFSRDFNCSLGSKMNPEKKCTVW